MLTLKSIRIRNFRAIKELTFTPKEEGITGIFGPNGAGKTSILTAVMFALYGSRPKGLTVGSLRKIGSEGEECSVSVVFLHLGQTVEIIREIRGTNNSVVAHVYVEGQQESKGAGGAADTWMKKRLGVDSEGFLTAFVVRQKELDAFVKAVPSERKKIIEKLAGVETINDALKKSREDENNSRKTVDMLPGSQDQVDAAGAEVDFYTSQAEDSKFDLEKVKLSLQALNEERNIVSTRLDKLREQQNNLLRVQGRINALTPEIPNIEQQLERIGYVKEVKDGEDVDSLRNLYQSVTQKLNDLRSTEASLRHNGQQLQLRSTQLTSLVADGTKRIAVLEKTVDADLETIVKQVDDNTARLHEISRRLVQLASQNEDLEESLQALHDSDDCPTCKTHLTDPDALRTQFREVIVSNTETLNDLENEQQKLFAANTGMEARRNAFNELSGLKEVTASNVVELASVTEQAASETPVVDALAAEIIENATEQERVVDLGSKARTLKEDRTLYATLLERKDEALLSLESARKEESEINKIFSTKELKDAQNKLEQTRADYEKLSTSNTNLTATLTEANVRFQNARNNYQRSYEQWNKKKVLQEAHASKSLTTDMLEKFRQDTVSSIAPEISDYATSLISDMTNGDFTEIKLDEEFQASLIDADGVERPVAWLSGGEESAVALALRLAVAFLITGGNPELLWLDEPLTAQDKDRRSAILTMIRKLPIKQILLINHAQEAQDIVDYEVTLKKGD